MFSVMFYIWLMFTIGHSAKFGSYTIMHMETNKILDLQLVQVSNP